ncbi:MAG: ATP-binding cassette domain-containing protein, partial [Bacteroidetes bacterium]|nr:ATP-binding cassette domain-containing protein [Bacteroidota bacterium]
LDLWSKRNTPANQLSGGLKRRLMIVRALIHEPELLILDEPTAGVDIEIRRSMWKFISDLNTKGRTIILTTHYLEEAENLCRNIAIIDKGKIIQNTSMKNLLSRMDKDTFIFDITNPIKKIPKLKDHNMKILDSTTIEVEILKKQNLNRLFEHFKKNKIEILNMRRKTARLEELFMDLVKNNKIPRASIELLEKGTSTKEEAGYAIQYCLENNVKQAIVLSSKFHTRRVKSIFRPLFEANGVELILRGAPSSVYSEDEWWKTEEGLIMVNNEYVKLVYYFFKY